MEALAVHLRRTGFAVTDRPTTYDATLYAMLVNIMRAPVESPLKKKAIRSAELVAYLLRMDKVLGGEAGGLVAANDETPLV